MGNNRIVHGAREELAKIRIAQALFLFRIGNKGGLHQHGRHLRGTQHHEIGVLHGGIVQILDSGQPANHDRRRGRRRIHGRRLGHIDEHRIEHGIVNSRLYITKEGIGGILRFGQPACRRITRPRRR